MMERAFRKIAEELREGEIVCIFPEGKLTADGQMNPFRPGIERILAETPAKVVPMALDGLWGSMFSRKDGPAMKKMPRRVRAKIRLSIGEPLDAGEATAAVLEAKVRELLNDEARAASLADRRNREDSGARLQRLAVRGDARAWATDVDPACAARS